jgi:hypothetical protein
MTGRRAWVAVVPGPWRSPQRFVSGLFLARLAPQSVAQFVVVSCACKQMLTLQPASTSHTYSAQRLLMP